MKRKRHGPATTARMPDPPAESAVAAEAAEAAVTGPICSGKTLMEAEELAQAVIPATGPEAADPWAGLQEAEQPAEAELPAAQKGAAAKLIARGWRQQDAQPQSNGPDMSRESLPPPPRPTLPPPAPQPQQLAVSAEGLRLHLSSRSSTGYKGVHIKPSSGRFQAQQTVKGRSTSIGVFDSAVEAAVAYARAVGEYQPRPPPAAVVVPEGLCLHHSISSSGYKGVKEHASGRFEARRYENGRPVSLGYFATAVEAAVAYARAAGEPSRLLAVAEVELAAAAACDDEAVALRESALRNQLGRAPGDAAPHLPCASPVAFAPAPLPPAPALALAPAPAPSGRVGWERT